MPIQMIIAICVGVLAIAGAVFVIADVRAYNKRKEEYSNRKNRSVFQQEQEIA